MKALFEEKGVQMKAKKQRQRKGREREGGPVGVVVHTVNSHHYKLESGS